MSDKGFDLNDSLDDLLDEVIATPLRPLDPAAPVADLPTAFVETCRKCGGTGYYRHLGPCFACKGKGSKSFKTSSEARAASRQSSAATAERRTAAALQAFADEHPAVWAWMDGNTFPFAIAMREAVAKWGALTDRQMAACLSAVAKRDAAKQAAVARAENAKVIDLAKIEAAFASASSTLKAPKLRVAGFIISHAKASSANAGSLYVREGETYLGKITAGKFIRSRDCADAHETKLLEIASDPKGAAIAYGRVTGQCACCGRPLENKESIERGIGPICATKFGW